MKAKKYSCYQCDGEFKIKTLSEEDMYPVYYCPYCGGDIDEPEIVDEEDDIEEDE